MAISQRHIRLLRPYLIGRPRKNGEWDMICPLHEDENRSASLNTLTGEWYCFAGCGGGRVADLIMQKSHWVSPGRAAMNGGSPRYATPNEVITEGRIQGWHAALLDDETACDYLVERGIHTKTMVDFEIGWDRVKQAYTIPVRGPKGEIWNIRRYTTRENARTKIWNVAGMRPTELYPIGQLEADRIIICEGEWDTLATIQHGYAAITRTSGAKTWYPRWNPLFKGKLVFIAQDCDKDGQNGATKIARSLGRTAEVRLVALPYPIEDKHGKDLTDYWNEHDTSDFESLLADAMPLKRRNGHDPSVITVLDSFDSHRVGDPVKLQVTIKGRKEPGYTVPWKSKLTCSQDAGPKCKICPMNSVNGEAIVEIPPTSPQILGMMGSSQLQIFDMIRLEYGAQKCGKLTIEVEDHQAVEELFARPSLDHSDGTQSGSYKNIKITSVGRYDTMANTTVIATGALYPNPSNQQNEFLAWEVTQQETSVDRFEMTAEAKKLMRRFQVRGRQRPLNKIGQIARELASHVTKIIGRPEMHALMDLTFHSPLSFKFGGQVVHRGWIESLIVGDTRTGKSEAAERLVRHFGAGEIVGGEAATLAGLVGGLQQLGGKDWAVTWGVIPINDRRLVIIDELSGLHPEEIAKMSDVRASGLARLTKIQQEVTFARTRLLWLGNPRNGGMEQFTYGVDSLRPLIGNPEDIARFDLAMALSKNDVDPEEYNKRLETGELHYTSEACHTLLMWVWTRQLDQVVWSRGAEEAIFDVSTEVGERYIEDPPLIQAANVRIKIARVAAAIAGRTFSTDETCEKIVINPAHVQDAVKFIDMLYEMPTFGYAERSHERILDAQEAEENKEDIRRYILERRNLAKLLRTNGRFRRQDIEEVMNVDRENANAIINKLYNARMIRKDGSMDNIVEPQLHALLKEVRW
jgi:hypothetical protein